MFKGITNWFFASERQEEIKKRDRDSELRMTQLLVSNLPTFNCETTGPEVRLFCDKFNRIISNNLPEYPEDYLQALLYQHLGAKASVWKGERETQPNSPQTAKEWIDEIFRVHYPSNDSRVCWSQLGRMKRNGTNLNEFVGRFRELMVRVTDKTEDEKTLKFIQAMDGIIKDRILDLYIQRKMAARPMGLTELIAFTQEYDIQLHMDGTPRSITVAQVQGATMQKERFISAERMHWSEEKKQRYLSNSCFTCGAAFGDPACKHRETRDKRLAQGPRLDVKRVKLTRPLEDPAQNSYIACSNLGIPIDIGGTSLSRAGINDVEKYPSFKCRQNRRKLTYAHASKTPHVRVCEVSNEHINELKRFRSPMHFAGRVRNQQVVVLLDTGATSNVIGFGTVAQLGLQVRTCSPLAVSYAAKDSSESISSWVSIFLQVGTYKARLQFYVANIGPEVIIGLPFFGDGSGHGHSLEGKDSHIFRTPRPTTTCVAGQRISEPYSTRAGTD